MIQADTYTSSAKLAECDSGEPVLPKAQDLLEQPLGKLRRVAISLHPLLELLLERFQPPLRFHTAIARRVYGEMHAKTGAASVATSVAPTTMVAIANENLFMVSSILVRAGTHPNRASP